LINGKRASGDKELTYAKKMMLKRQSEKIDYEYMLNKNMRLLEA
jgi:hypothetical protein